MKTLYWLVKREFWEHRGGFLRAPAITAAAFLAIFLMTIIVTTHQVEEIEHILTDLMFIRDGKIVLNTDMEAMGDRFAEVMVSADKAATARQLNPLDERQVFGKSIFLFDGVDQSRLAELGEIRRPSVSDLFVATMKGTYA